MSPITHRTVQHLARLAGACLVAAPIALGAIGQFQATGAHAAPTLMQLLPNEQIANGYSHAVAVSGNTAVVGSIGDNGQGAAYVFVKHGATWAEQARLVAPDATGNDLFGVSVAISGNTILVGAPGHTATDCNATPNQQTGAVYEFDRNGTTWSTLGTLGCGLAGDSLGASVAIDGPVAVLGAPNYHQATGVGYLFHAIAPGDWQLQKTALADDGQAGDHFGSAVAISGGTAVIGAPDATINGPQNDHAPVLGAGAAYVFISTGQPVKSGMAWTQQVRLIAPIPASYAHFAASVALRGDTVLAGAPFDGAGTAYIATRSGTNWGTPLPLRPSDATSLGQFGSAVALSGLSGQPTTALVGAYGLNAAYVFQPSGMTWTQSAKLTQPGALGLGSAVALDGTNAVIGALYGNNYIGAAFSASLINAATIVAPPAMSSSTTVNDTDPRILYSGTGWGYYNGRNVGDINDDVHATLINGDSASFTFTGTGISYITEKSVDEGKVAIYLDGRFKKTANCQSILHNQGGQVLFSVSGLPAGSHTLMLVKRSGTYMLLDAFIVR